MNIVRENLKDKTIVLKVTIGEADYNEAVDKKLREYKRKANIPGFRPGMVPMGVINKMYRKGTVAEEAYRLASRECFEYADKNKIEYIGDIIPSEQQGDLDFDNSTDFEFVFELAEAPKVDIELSAKDKVTKYTIKIDDKMRQGYRENFTRRFGRLVDVETVEKDEALSVTLDQEEMKIEDAYVGLIGMDDKERKPFIGKKVGDVMQVNVNELYKTPSQRAAILQMKEDELDAINPEFTLTITKIRKFAEPEINAEFFKMAFPDGTVTSEAQMKEYFDAQISKDLSREVDYMFSLQMRKMLMDKAKLDMPKDFLKRWLFAINEGKFSMEEIEKDFDQFVDMMAWNLIKKHYITTLDIKATDEDILAEAKAMAAMQFAYYGMGNVADDMLENYAKSILGNKEEANKIYEKLYEAKVVEALAPMVGVSEKAVSVEEFGKLAEKL